MLRNHKEHEAIKGMLVVRVVRSTTADTWISPFARYFYFYIYYIIFSSTIFLFLVFLYVFIFMFFSLLVIILHVYWRNKELLLL